MSLFLLFCLLCLFVCKDCKTNIATLRAELAEEDQKLQIQQEENARRKHNFVPFIMQLLICLARKSLLPQLRESALEKAKSSASRNRKR